MVENHFYLVFSFLRSEIFESDQGSFSRISLIFWESRFKSKGF